MRKNKKIKVIFFFLLLFVFLLGADFVSALEIEYPEIFGLQITEDSTFPEYANYFFNFGMAIAGALALLAISIGGILYLISSIIGGMKGRAKEWIKAGIVGLLILLSSYLIVWTINPNLVHFGLQELLPVSLPGNGGNGVIPQVPEVKYEEIPIGTLTENLLSRKTSWNCYDFDVNGNPVFKLNEDGDIIWQDDHWPVSTLGNHDRVDCLWKTADAIEIKTRQFKLLAEKIIELDKKCNCGELCIPDCPSGDGPACDYPTPISGPGLSPPCRCFGKIASCDIYCTGRCKDASCKCPFEECPQDDPYCCDPCPVIDEEMAEELNLPDYLVGKRTREITEHGPIIVDNEPKRGLDEFRTQYPLCNQLDSYPQDYEYIQCIKDDIELLLIPIKQFENKRLVDQLRYLKVLIEIRREEIKKDLEVLQGTEENNYKDGAEYKLGECYLAKSSVDFLKIKEETDKKDKNITTEKVFEDPFTNQYINTSKYCEGFSYQDNQFFRTCGKICPSFDIQCFKGCSSDNLECLENCFLNNKCLSSSIYSNLKECLLDSENICFEKAKFLKEKCEEECEEKTFEICNENESCKEKNQAECKTKCEKDYNKDINECSTNSQCFIEYTTSEGEPIGISNPPQGVQLKKDADDKYIIDKCYLSLQCVKDCADEFEDEDVAQRCIREKCFKCEYATKQNSGYIDCLGSSHAWRGIDSLRAIFSWAGERMSYSSFLSFEHPGLQKCRMCEMKTEGGEIKYLGVTQYPECGKCPSCSPCPECPCSVSGDIYRLSSAECSKYSFSGDPLTFYCRENWWEEENQKRETPLGEEQWVCDKEKEIPIGQAVDESEKWAEELIELTSELIRRTNYMLEYNIKEIGKEVGYCECDSKVGGCIMVDRPAPSPYPPDYNFCLKDEECNIHRTNKTPHYECENEKCVKKEGPGLNLCFIDQHCISGKHKTCSKWIGDGEQEDCCKTGCEYYDFKEIDPDTGEWTGRYRCECRVKDCEGNPCQKIIDMLEETGRERDEELGGYYEWVKESFEELEELIKGEKRSEALKKLTYSREKIDQWSKTIKIERGERKILSCQRVKDEVIPPTVETGSRIVLIDQEGNLKDLQIYCYGKEAGEILGSNRALTDNWFSCEKREEE